MKLSFDGGQCIQSNVGTAKYDNDILRCRDPDSALDKRGYRAGRGWLRQQFLGFQNINQGAHRGFIGYRNQIGHVIGYDFELRCFGLASAQRAAEMFRAYQRSDWQMRPYARDGGLDIQFRNQHGKKHGRR